MLYILFGAMELKDILVKEVENISIKKDIKHKLRRCNVISENEP